MNWIDLRRSLCQLLASRSVWLLSNHLELTQRQWLRETRQPAPTGAPTDTCAGLVNICVVFNLKRPPLTCCSLNCFFVAALWIFLKFFSGPGPEILPVNPPQGLANIHAVFCIDLTTWSALQHHWSRLGAITALRLAQSTKINLKTFLERVRLSHY